MLSGNNFWALQVQQRERIGYTLAQATIIVWSIALKNMIVETRLDIV